MPVELILNLCVFGLLMFLSAFFSSTETAFTSLSTAQIQTMATRKGKRGQLVQKLTSTPGNLITAILIGNNLVNIWASVLATEIATMLTQDGNTGIVIGVVTLLVLVFGEVIPKQYAIHHNEGLSMFSAPVIWILIIILRPLIWALTVLSNFTMRLFGGKKRSPVTLEGLVQLVNLARSLGLLRRQEQNIVRNAFRFKETPVKSILTHRTDVFSLPEDMGFQEALPQLLENGFSRIPIHAPDAPEKITGILLMQDILHLIGTSSNQNLSELATPPLHVPGSRKASDLFALFKKESLNMAIVLDEYGGLAGIVTREDVLEEIMGELYDEDETKEEEKVTRLEENHFRIIGDTPIHMVNDYCGLSINPEISQSFGGYIVEQYGHIPQMGEKISLDEGIVIIRKMDKRQIIKVDFFPKRKKIES